ncbi:chromosome segregation protein Spc25-domain-containing protein [Absidia repens]|uniref:Kinetochore protein SPC25 n=1 Tax=Absidia repens TaxID=90262 RepID=A0A1X2IWB5_9FUNG|nr:chromosome segregation protein Spc25-domain-containing protein [Absidia repens]
MDTIIEHETLPSPDIDVDLLEQQVSQVKQKTTNYMDSVVKSYKTILFEKRQKALALKDVIKKKNEELEKLTQDRKHYESERAEIKSLEEQTKAMEIKLESIRKNHEQARQRIADQEKASAIRKKKIDICTKNTGLVYHPIKENYLKFDFTLIDPHQWDKIFTFTLHMAHNGTYKVEECDPMIPNLDTLTKDLNQHRDPNLFIKLVRREFCALASSSTAPIVPSSPSSVSSSSPLPLLSPQKPDSKDLQHQSE